METMGRAKRPRRSFTREFKAEVVELVRQPSNTAASVARDLDLTETAVREWVNQTDVDEGRRGGGLTTAEREELAQLRKENRVLREERPAKLPLPSGDEAVALALSLDVQRPPTSRDTSTPGVRSR